MPLSEKLNQRVNSIKLFYQQKPLIFIIPIIALLIIFFYWLLVARFHESTDNAYVKSNLTAISPQVEGYITQIYLDEGAQATTDAVIIKIDDAQYKASLDVAEQQLQQAYINLDQINNKYQAQQLNIPKTQTQLNTSQTQLDRLKSNFTRSQDLINKKYLSQQDFDMAQADFIKAKNDFSSGKIDVQQANLDLQQIQIDRLNALSIIKERKAKVDLARINLNNTVIRAPASGIIGQRSCSIGEYVVPGTILIYLIPLDNIWIMANFKETQVENMRPNQKVKIKIDAFSGHTFDGKIVAISPAAGSEFSLLPADNSTGNFTKIVQRVPVKIELFNPQRLRVVPGMSSDVTVKTNSA